MSFRIKKDHFFLLQQMHECLIPCSKREVYSATPMGRLTNKDFRRHKSSPFSRCCLVKRCVFSFEFPCNSICSHLATPNTENNRTHRSFFSRWLSSVFHLYCTYVATPTLWAGWRRPENWNKSDSKKIHAENKMKWITCVWRGEFSQISASSHDSS